MATGKVKLGVLGAGNIAAMNVKGYLEHADCDVVAVCDVDEKVAKEAAAEWGVPKVYTSIDDLLGDGEIEALEILTPTHLHHDHAIAALRAGKHVSIQKPVANTVDDAIEMGAVAKETGKILRISECFVHYPPMELARKLVLEGAIGKPTAMRIKTIVGQTDAAFQANLRPEGYGWRLDTRSPGGHLFDDMVHKYAMAMWLVDQDIVSVQSLVRRRDLFFEPMAAIFEYADPDMIGVMEVHYAPHMWLKTKYYGADEFIEIQGDEGMLWVTRATGEMLDMPPVILYQGKDNDIKVTEFKEIDADWGSGFVRSSAHFVEALLNGTPAAMSPEEAVKVLQLCFAVYAASDGKHPVDPRSITSGSVTPVGWADW